MQVQKKHFRSWLGGFDLAEGGFDRTSRTPPGYGHGSSEARAMIFFVSQVFWNKDLKLTHYNTVRSFKRDLVRQGHLALNMSFLYLWFQ